ncbi:MULTISPECIES: glycosyltransferase [unclassified Microcoleus]|uniref:glycosyltransferase n=1 Tax=unclassified Microcoleus TaxID=2642155 RepID=UPI002FD76C87
MNESLPPIYFYIPKSQWPVGKMPKIPQEYWKWMSSWGSRYGRGKYDWTLQTYLYLKADGLPCQLIDFMPDEGIVLSHRDFLSDNLQPLPKLLVVCIKVDREPHPYAQLQVVQNDRDPLFSRSPFLWQCHPLKFWLQPGLIPRDAGRGEIFENAAFFGVLDSLAPELQAPSWGEKLGVLGLDWQVVGCDRWHDYSKVDVIVAVRSFEGELTFDSKPPSKLINAWHAGIPAVLGRESAYRRERKSQLDYIEVASPEEAIAAVEMLRGDRNLRAAMIENGRIRAQETANALIISQWRNFLTNVAVPAYYRWCTASIWQQQIFLARRHLIMKANRLQSRLNQFISKK